VVGEDDQEARIAIVSDGDEGVATRLRTRGVLVNTTDNPALCDFTLPAIVDRDPVLVAIGTGGASAGLAKALRQRLELLLPARLGALASALFARRDAVRAKWPNTGDRRRAIDAGLARGGPIDPMREDAVDAVPSWIAAGGDSKGARLVPIRLLSGDPDDLTLRAARLLGEADRIYHQPDVPPELLDRARADAVRIVAPVSPADPGDGLSLFLSLR
jgi:uroporphyrin-III C-methyltransferase/precorrin-2 dehydrogenase/sirohydrochlorin ferrochelatase